MTTIASEVTSLTVVYSTVYSDVDQRKHQSSASLAFVWGIRRDRWIPRTKGQLRGKCFHLMTSSWVRKIFTGPTYKSFWALWAFHMFTGPLFQIKLVLFYSVIVKAFRELWNPPSKAVPGKFLGSDGHSKCNCLQGRANFHRSRTWLIILIFNMVQIWADVKVFPLSLRWRHNGRHCVSNHQPYDCLLHRLFRRRSK